MSSSDDKDSELSIVIPVYNSQAQLDSLLNRLIKLFKSEKIEIVIVDDGSAIPISINKNYLKKENFSFCLIRHQTNKSLFQARLTGIMNSSGRFITSIDSDDYLTLFRWKEIRKKFETIPKLDIYSFPIFIGRFAFGSDLWEEVCPYGPTMKVGHFEVWEFYTHNRHWNFVGKIYRSSFLKKVTTSLDKSLYVNFAEDFLLTSNIFYSARGFFFEDGLAQYHYSVNSDSITKKTLTLAEIDNKLSQYRSVSEQLILLEEEESFSVEERENLLLLWRKNLIWLLSSIPLEYLRQEVVLGEIAKIFSLTSTETKRILSQHIYDLEDRKKLNSLVKTISHRLAPTFSRRRCILNMLKRAVVGLQRTRSSKL